MTTNRSEFEGEWRGMCHSGRHGLDYRGQVCYLCAHSFAVWPKDGSDVGTRVYKALTASQAAEQCARDDYTVDRTWPVTYSVRDNLTGELWTVLVGVVAAPSFVALDVSEVSMQPATHVLWGGKVLCEDLRLRGVPRDWPEGQRWISLKIVADAVAAPLLDRCETCWKKVPGLVTGLRLIGAGP